MSSYNLGDGGGGGLLGGEPYDNDPQQWVIRPYTDPQTNETYDIVDGCVIVQFEGAPLLPTEDPLAYDDPETAPPPVGDPNFDQSDQNVVTLTTATGAEVVAAWPGIKSLALMLPPNITVEQAVGTWATTFQGVVSVNPDPVHYPQHDPTPNDPLYWYQYYLYCQPRFRDQYTRFGIDALSAWDFSYHHPTRAWTTHVIVIDTGIERAHPDLGSHLNPLGINQTFRVNKGLWGPGFGNPWWNLQTPTASSPKDVAHGTAIAGIIAGTTNNSLGVAGILGTENRFDLVPIAMNCHWDPPTGTIVTDTVTEVNSFNDIGIMRGMWVKWRNESPPFILGGSYVVNYSWGGDSPDPVLEKVLRPLGKYMVIAIGAGNRDTGGRTPPMYPARYADQDGLIAVAAIGDFGLKADFSDYGYPVVFAAPGEMIQTTDMTGVLGYYRVASPAGDYSLNDLQGTSFSAPMVAATAGFIRSINRLMTPAAVKQELISNGATAYDPVLFGVKYLDFYSVLADVYYNHRGP